MIGALETLMSFADIVCAYLLGSLLTRLEMRGTVPGVCLSSLACQHDELLIVAM